MDDCRAALARAEEQLQKAEALNRAGRDYSAPLAECDKATARAAKLIKKLGGEELDLAPGGV